MVNGKTALITGSVTGLGKRTAMELAKHGANLVLNYRNHAEQATQFAAELRNEHGIEVLCVQGDVSQHEDCAAIVEQAVAHFDAIDILVNNAGPYVSERKPTTDYDIEQWNYIINGNLNGPFYLSRLVIPSMREKKWGRIVNIGFDRADSAPGWIYRSAFASAKVGLVSLTKTLSLEESANGITVNMVCPGDIVGDWKVADIETARGTEDPATPVKRPGTGEDIARVIAFLCNKDSDFITGSVIQVTGAKDVLSKIRV